MCNCIVQMDKVLESHNTRLDTLFNLTNKDLPMEFVQISVIKKDRDVRGKPMKIIPQFCPFCGQEYKGKPDAKLSDPAAG